MKQINLVTYTAYDLEKTMMKMVKEQKLPLSIVFKHIGYLAGNRYFDVYPITELNPKMDRAKVDFNVNVMRQLMLEFQSPNVNQAKFIKEFVEALWVKKSNDPNYKAKLKTNNSKQRIKIK